MDIGSVFGAIQESTLEARARMGICEREGADGKPYCDSCGEPLFLELHFSGPIAERMGSTKVVPRSCRCMRAVYEREKAEMEALERARRIEEQRITSIAEGRYRVMRFDKDDGRAPKIRNMCQRYVEKHTEMVSGNYGLALCGINGTGKTFWASCMANALIDAGASVYMTTLKRLIDDMSREYGEYRGKYLGKIRDVDFLILDDYGAERGTEFSLEQAFEVIDTRYNAGKPLIITTNLTEESIKNPPTINHGRAYSRIIEMCPAIITVEGEHRQQIAAEKKQALAAILRG